VSRFPLKLEKTYFNAGFFNVRVGFDEYVRHDNGPITLILGDDGRSTQGIVSRTANRNGTARIFGRQPLREWFQTNFSLYDIVNVDFVSFERIRLGRPLEK
jgi:hypothetical protein